MSGRDSIKKSRPSFCIPKGTPPITLTERRKLWKILKWLTGSNIASVNRANDESTDLYGSSTNEVRVVSLCCGKSLQRVAKSV